MDIKENFHSKLQTIREDAEVKPNRTSELVSVQTAAKNALGHLRRHDYGRVRKIVRGTPLEGPLDDHLKQADFHWEHMNIKNNLAIHPSKSDKDARKLRDEGKHHQDRAELHHGKAEKYLEGHLP